MKAHEGRDVIARMDGVVAAAFFDVDESGRQDIVVVHREAGTRAVWNNYVQRAESLFFKSTALSSVRYQDQLNESSSSSRTKAYVGSHGATFELSFRAADGQKHASCAQCAGGGGGSLALQTCNCFFGLMRMSNYIEEVAMGVGRATRTWANMMPNAVTVVWPLRASSEKEWWMEYFTQRRGGQMLGVVIVLCVILAVLAVVIWYLTWKEAKQDARDAYYRAAAINLGT